MLKILILITLFGSLSLSFSKSESCKNSLPCDSTCGMKTDSAEVILRSDSLNIQESNTMDTMPMKIIPIGAYPIDSLSIDSLKKTDSIKAQQDSFK